MIEIQKQCRVSGKNFIISDEEQNLLTKWGIPLPTLCPEERLCRRLAARNENSIYRRKCDLCDKIMIAIFDTSAPFQFTAKIVGGQIHGIPQDMDVIMIFQGHSLSSFMSFKWWFQRLECCN